MMEKINWQKFTRLINAKIGALRVAAEKFPAGPAKAAYEHEVFMPVFGLLMEFTECTGGAEEWSVFTPEEIDLLAAHAHAPPGTAFPADIAVRLERDDGSRLGEG